MVAENPNDDWQEGEISSNKCSDVDCSLDAGDPQLGTTRLNPSQWQGPQEMTETKHIFFQWKALTSMARGVSTLWVAVTAATCSCGRRRRSRWCSSLMLMSVGWWVPVTLGIIRSCVLCWQNPQWFVGIMWVLFNTPQASAPHRPFLMFLPWLVTPWPWKLTNTC